MALEPPFASKALGHDLDSEMTLALAGARVTRMQMALICDLELDGRKGSLEA